jgi:hypothetical protein
MTNAETRDGKAFEGELAVGCLTQDTLPFELRAEQLILRADSIGFTFTGQDDPKRGRFFATGAASRQGHLFRCEDVPLQYQMEAEPLPTCFKFEAFEVSRNDETFCYVSGELWDASGRWIFHGLLSPRVPPA